MSVRGAYKAKRNGEFFENLISASCIHYANKEIAYIQKTPEPMRPVRAMNRAGGHFLAIYEKKAQPDFAGTLSGGRSIVFEAKHTQETSIRFDRINMQQEKDLEAHHKLGALAFILISFNAESFYKVPYLDWLQLQVSTGKKSVNEKDLAPYKVPNKGRVILFLNDLEREVKQ